MAHQNGEQLYHRLGHKIDGLQMRTPWNEAFYDLLKTLYTAEQAEVIVKMPYGLARLDKIQKVTGYDRVKLERILDGLCAQGLVIDLWIQDEYRYMPSPMVVGIFELVMMRTGETERSKEWARLLNSYMHGDDTFYRANCAHHEQVAVMRTVPHGETVLPSEYTEVLDYEKAAAIVESADRFAIGLCSCRHEKLHLGHKACNVPLDTCAAFGPVADFEIRRGFGHEVSKAEMRDNLERSKDLKLVLTADNVKQRVGFMCQCCKCCCNLMLGVTRHGYPNAVITSSFVSEVNRGKCTGCERCVAPCPVNAIEVLPVPNPKSIKNKTIRINEELCLGCGVCGLVCALDGINLVKRKQRVLHPETTFERVILMCLERGTLQNQLFPDPQSVTEKTMRGIIGGFLRLPPVKRALMSDALRSRFLAGLGMGTRAQGRDWLRKF